MFNDNESGNETRVAFALSFPLLILVIYFRLF